MSSYASERKQKVDQIFCSFMVSNWVSSFCHCRTDDLFKNSVRGWICFGRYNSVTSLRFAPTEFFIRLGKRHRKWKRGRTAIKTTQTEVETTYAWSCFHSVTKGGSTLFYFFVLFMLIFCPHSSSFHPWVTLSCTFNICLCSSQPIFPSCINSSHISSLSRRENWKPVLSFLRLTFKGIQTQNLNYNNGQKWLLQLTSF